MRKAKYEHIWQVKDALFATEDHKPLFYHNELTLYEDGGAIFIYHINGDLIYSNEKDSIEAILAEALGIELGVNL